MQQSHNLRPYITKCAANPNKPFKVQLRARQEGTTKLVNVHMGRYATKVEADAVAAYGDTLRRRVEIKDEVKTLKMFRELILAGNSIKLAFDLCLPFEPAAEQPKRGLVERVMRFFKMRVIGV